MKKSLQIGSQQNSPEWENLQLEQLKLQVEQVRLDIQLRKLGVKESSNRVLCDKIEHARRNVEVISKVLGSFNGQTHDTMRSVLLENLVVLKEVKDIK